MPVRFFGQFLVDEGVIDEAQLREALDLMFWVNRNIGELARKRAYLSAADVAELVEAQASADARFGELAVARGMLRPEQVDELLRAQDDRQLRLGEALVELGHLDEQDAKALLGRYDAEQAALVRAEAVRSPLLQIPRVRALIEWLPKQALRRSRLPLKLGPARCWAGDWEPELAIGTRLDAEPAEDGAPALEVVLGTDPALALALVAGPRSLRDPEEGDTLPGEFADWVRCWLENAVATDRARPCELPTHGLALDLVAPLGTGVLVITGLD